MQQLEDLAERLLRGGVGYRHVRRYIGELRDHYDDAVRSETARGASAESAHALALARLGTMDDLARGMIARPELRALSTRFPKLWSCGLPTALWLGTFLVIIVSFINVTKGFNLGGIANGGSPELAHWQEPADTFLFLLVRVLPVVVGGFMLMLALRQRMEMSWPLIGVALLAGLSGTAETSLIFSTSPGTAGEFSFGFGMSPEILARSAGMFALMLTPLVVRKYFTRPPV
jgi:hypothetical protein